MFCEQTILELKAVWSVFFFISVAIEWKLETSNFNKHENIIWCMVWYVIQVVAGLKKKVLIRNDFKLHNFIQNNTWKKGKTFQTFFNVINHTLYLFCMLQSRLQNIMHISILFIIYLCVFFTLHSIFSHWMKAKISTRTQNMALESYTW